MDVEYISPQIHEEYTFRHRSACRTPAVSGQEYLTSRKEYIEPHKIQHQALSPTDRSLTPWTRCTLEKRVW